MAIVVRLVAVLLLSHGKTRISTITYPMRGKESWSSTRTAPRVYIRSGTDCPRMIRQNRGNCGKRSLLHHLYTFHTTIFPFITTHGTMDTTSPILPSVETGMKRKADEAWGQGDSEEGNMKLVKDNNERKLAQMPAAKPPPQGGAF